MKHFMRWCFRLLVFCINLNLDSVHFVPISNNVPINIKYAMFEKRMFKYSSSSQGLFLKVKTLGRMMLYTLILCAVLCTTCKSILSHSYSVSSNRSKTYAIGLFMRHCKRRCRPMFSFFFFIVLLKKAICWQYYL